MSAVNLPALAVPQMRPCIQARGPKPNKVLILGEAPGEQEERLGIPFVGASGKELDRMLSEAGWNPGSIYMTNVFWTRPPNNNLQALTVSAKDWKTISAIASQPPSGQLSSPTSMPLPPLKLENKIRHLHPNLYPELERLRQEIEEVNPNLILALGNTALWFLTGRQNISSMRGTTLSSQPICGRSYKVLPTYHPAAVLRQWDLRPIVVADLMKAKRQAEFPEIRRPKRLIIHSPSLTEIADYLGSLVLDLPLAVDIETRLGQITEIGFSQDPTLALVVPFIQGFKDHYWASPGEEVAALRLVQAVLQHPCPKVLQNGLYDIQYIWKTWGFPPRNCLYDTMLRHHSLFPELPKGLGFLGSIYTDEPAWKIMRNKKDTVEKRDDE